MELKRNIFNIFETASQLFNNYYNGAGIDTDYKNHTEPHIIVPARKEN